MRLGRAKRAGIAKLRLSLLNKVLVQRERKQVLA